VDAEVAVTVTNAGTATATYTIVLTSATKAFDQRTATTSLAGGARVVLRVPVDTSQLPAGRYVVTATLSSDLRGAALSTDTATLVVG
jgi:hypothetical protein